MVLPKAFVPRLIVTDSRIVTFSPIIVWVSSPSYFISCGISPNDILWKIVQLEPIDVPEQIVL